MNGDVALKYAFALEINGIDEFLIQEITIPDEEFGIVEMGRAYNEANMKIASKYKIGEFTIKKALSTNKSESWLADWIKRVKEGNRANYVEFAVLKVLAKDGKVAKRYDLGEIFPSKKAVESFVRTDEGILYETGTFAISRFEEFSE
jgi:hypothetical protein